MYINVLEDYKKRNNINRPIILDGALGSILEFSFPQLNDKDIWMTKFIFDQPHEIKNIYSQYILKGANIITTSTFRTNPYSLSTFYEKNTHSSFISSSQYVERAVKLALEFKNDENILVAGSNPPAEDCYIKRTIKDYEKLKDNHYNHINDLFKYGADFILNETLGHFDEIDIVTKICYNNDIPSVVSLYFDESLNLICGKSVFDTISYIDTNFNLLAVSTNCIDYKTFKKMTENKNLLTNLRNRFGYYLNCGDLCPKDMSGILKKFAYLDPIFVGTCCMSNPDYTESINDFYK
jgi:homocysteine S-methyltransferase